jgi:hypothetical protein
VEPGNRWLTVVYMEGFLFGPFCWGGELGARGGVVF